MKLTIQIPADDQDDDSIADRLEYIDGLIRQGFTSGHEPTWSYSDATPTPQPEQEQQEGEPLLTGYICGLRGLSLEMTQVQAESASHAGQCDEDVAALTRRPEIAAQLDAIDADDIRAALKECGAWDAEQLADDQDNRERAVWLAACDIRQQQSETPDCAETAQEEQEQQETAAPADHTAAQLAEHMQALRLTREREAQLGSDLARLRAFVEKIARMSIYGDGEDEIEPDGEDAVRVLNWHIAAARQLLA